MPRQRPKPNWELEPEHNINNVEHPNITCISKCQLSRKTIAPEMCKHPQQSYAARAQTIYRWAMQSCKPNKTWSPMHCQLRCITTESLRYSTKADTRIRKETSVKVSETGMASSQNLRIISHLNKKQHDRSGCNTQGTTNTNKTGCTVWLNNKLMSKTTWDMKNIPARRISKVRLG